MAQLIPSLGSAAGRMQAGERRFAERLVQKLEDDYLCWYDVPIGPRQFHPDFILLHPRRGFVVLEVKDWKLETIHAADRRQITLLTSSGLTRKGNPMETARMNAMQVEVLLRTDPALRNPPGHRYEGKLVMPYGWGTVLTHITRRQFESAGLDQVIEPGRTICRDEMLESVDAEDFQRRLWEMFSTVFPATLTLPQMERVRWHLFPELRLATAQGQFGLFDGKPADGALTIPDLLRIMDVQQEQLARSLGDGHRVIHGVAGSGKTMILGYRALHLSRAAARPVLVICYNVTLASRLKQLLRERGASELVNVYSFHEWCRAMLTAYQVDVPRNHGDYDAYTQVLVERTIHGVEKGLIPRAQYGAVLIDEGHDFEPEWFKLVVQMLDPATNALLVLYDDAQSIYAKDRGRRFSFKSVGVQAQGRSTILRLNYRNTLEVLFVAKAFAEDLLSPRDEDDDAAPIIAPQTAGRRGAAPELLRCASRDDEARVIVERVQAQIAAGRPPSDIAVLVRARKDTPELERRLVEAGVPFYSAFGGGAKRALFEGPPSIKILTRHSSKGLEFGAVFIPRAADVPRAQEQHADEARLLYVAMTRATEQLVMTYSQETLFSARLQEAIARLAAT